MDKLENFADQANRLMAGLVFATQSAFIDYFLIYHLGNLWFLWIIADLTVVGVMLYAFVVTYLYKLGHFTRFLPYPSPGDLPFAYGVWVFYSISLAVRTGILFKSVAPTLTEATFFGQNLLQVSACLAVPFLYFLIKSVSLRKHCNLKHSTELLMFCEETLNIIDGIDILTIMFSASNVAKLTAGLPDAIIAFGCIALVIPTLNLAVFSVTKYDARFGLSRIIRAVYVLSALFLINLPLLILRLVSWHTSKVLASLFVCKNITFIIVHFLDIINIIISQQPGQYEVDGEANSLPMKNPSKSSLPQKNVQVKPPEAGDTPRPSAMKPQQNNQTNRRRPLPTVKSN